MSFVWSDAEQVKASHYEELKDNINTVRSDIGLSSWSWSSVPVAKGSYLTPYNPTDEVRNALDDTDNNNVCTANYINQYVPYCGTAESVDNAGYNGGFHGCFGYCSIYWTPNYTTILNSDNAAYDPGCGTDNSSANTGWHASVQYNWLHYYNPSNV